MKYKIVKIDENESSFSPVILLENGERRSFAYPKGEGWNEKINDRSAWILDVEKQLRKMQEQKEKDEKVDRSELGKDLEI